MVLTVANGGAVAGSLLPASGGAKIAFPKWPGSTLQGAYGVDLAAGFAVRIALEELAVPVVELQQALP